MKRISDVIEASTNDKKSLTGAAEKIHRMISLFIDKDLGNEIFKNLKTIIDGA